MRQQVVIAVMLTLSLGGMAMGGTKVLTEAKRAKKDEFYTQLNYRRDCYTVPVNIPQRFLILKLVSLSAEQPGNAAK